MRLLGIALAMLLGQSIVGQQAPSATVAGVVIKQGTDEPLSKATVLLYTEKGPGYSTTTAADGKFVFYGVTPGQYRMSATRTGYLRAEFGDRASNGCGTPVALVAGQRLPDARIAMMPSGVISGHLYDSDREGMPGVSAYALKYAYQNGRRVLTIVQTVQTNDLGEYRLFGLTPGRYYVAAALAKPSSPIVFDRTVQNSVVFIPAVPPGNAAQPIEPTMLDAPMEAPPQGDRFLPVYFPGARDASTARSIELRPGENSAGIDIAVTFSHAVRIRGKIANAVSLTPRLTVALVSRLEHPNAGNSLRVSTVKPDGSFEIPDVLPGAYFLVVSGSDAIGRLTGRALADVGDKDLENAVIEVSRGLELTGRVTVDDPKVMERIMEIAFRSIGPAVADAASSDLSVTVNRADGSFKLQGITPGDYLPFLTFLAPADIYVKALRLGARDVRDGIRLDSQPASQLEIVVGNNGAVVEGSVLNDKQSPAAGATVVLVPDVFLRKRSTLYKTRTTDASGHFRFDAIGPGEYKVFAWEEVEKGAWEDPDFLRPLESRGKAITLREGSTESVQIPLSPSAGPIYGQCDPSAAFR